MHRQTVASRARRLIAHFAPPAPRRIAMGLLVNLGLGALGGCASVPNVEPAIDQSANTGGEPQLVGARGPLGAGGPGGGGGGPKVEPPIDQPANPGGEPQLVGARGPLGADQSKAILD